MVFVTYCCICLSPNDFSPVLDLWKFPVGLPYLSKSLGLIDL